MQGQIWRTFILAVVTTTLIIFTALAAASAQPTRSKGTLATGLSGTTGLVMDSRSYVYTADGASGRIYCIPPDGEPIVYATMEKPATALALDHHRTLFVATNDGLIHGIRLDGDRFEAYRSSAPVAGLSVDRDGNLIVALTTGTLIKVKIEEQETE